MIKNSPTVSSLRGLPIRLAEAISSICCPWDCFAAARNDRTRVVFARAVFVFARRLSAEAISSALWDCFAAARNDSVFVAREIAALPPVARNDMGF